MNNGDGIEVKGKKSEERNSLKDHENWIWGGGKRWEQLQILLRNEEEGHGESARNLEIASTVSHRIGN